MEHDLFCRHHQQWRRGALLELAQLHASELQQQVAAAHSESAGMPMDDTYQQLLRGWGQRVQLVAPLQMDSQEMVQQAVAHWCLE